MLMLLYTFMHNLYQIILSKNVMLITYLIHLQNHRKSYKRVALLQTFLNEKYFQRVFAVAVVQGYTYYLNSTYVLKVITLKE